MEAEIKVGDKFNSFVAAESAVNEFGARKFTKYYCRDSRKIAAVQDRFRHEFDPALIYYELKYACIRGGKKFSKTGKGIRTTTTVKTGCPVHITFRATRDGKYLEVRSLENNHNHETSEDLYAKWPHKRSEKNLAKKMLDLQCNKELLQQKLAAKSGKVLTLRDLSNFTRKFDKESEQNLNDAVQIIKDKYNADVVGAVDQTRRFIGLFVQTHGMKQIMEAYPEFLAIDGTYKLLDVNLNIPVFMFLVEDSNCQSEIIAIALVANKRKETIEWMLDIFKRKNPSWGKIKSIMTNKDVTERGVLKVKFPDANHLICSFHALRTFSREVTTEKMGITQSQRNSCLEILQLMVSARNEEEFNTHLQNLESIAPQSVLDYYYKNWHGIEEDWHLGPNYHHSNFLNSINNRLESMNSKLKSVSSKRSTLLEFFEKLFKLLETIENERNHNAVMTVLKKTATFHDPNSPEYLYFDLLTRDSATYVENELKEHKNLSPSLITDDRFVFESREGNIDSTSDSCTCSFRRSMSLPCKHIFYVRNMINLGLFDKGLCSVRWHREFSLHNQRAFLRNDDIGEEQMTVRRFKSVGEKRRIASREAARLIDTLSVCRRGIFEKRVKVLEDLIVYWGDNEEVELVKLGNNSSDFENDYNGEVAEVNVDENDYNDEVEEENVDEEDYNGEVSEENVDEDYDGEVADENVNEDDYNGEVAEENVDDDLMMISSSVTDGGYSTEVPQDYLELDFHVPDVPDVSFYTMATEDIPISPHVSDAACLSGMKMPTVVRKQGRPKVKVLKSNVNK